MQRRRREFLLLDYEANSALLATYVSMRLAVVGVVIPIFGYLLTLPQPRYPFAARVGTLVLILTTDFASIRILGAINRNIFARCLHLAWVEQELGQLGFFSYWDNYALRCSNDTSSYAVVVASRTVNLVATGYVALEGARMASGIYPAWVTLVLLLAVSAAGLHNEVYIKHRLRESGFLSSLAVDLQEARSEAKQELAARHRA